MSHPISSRRRRAPRVLGTAAALTMLPACAATTYDTSVTTQGAGSTTTTTLPQGAAADLLPALVTEASGLSTRIVDGDDERGALARIEALWAAARDEVDATHPDLVVAFDRSVALCRTAVERTRPADADKAARNLATLVDSVV